MFPTGEYKKDNDYENKDWKYYFFKPQDNISFSLVKSYIPATTLLIYNI